MRLPALLSASLLASGSAYAVYAPIPEIEKGQPLIVDLRAGAYYDSNIFGSEAGEIDSMVYTLSPQFRLNVSPGSQTFLRGSYALDIQSFEDRPGDEDTQLNHVLNGTLAHTFSERSEITITETFAKFDNPESALALDVFQPDQSFLSNRLGADMSIGMSPLLVLEPSITTFFIQYDNKALATLLDYFRWDAKAGVAYLYSERTRLLLEGRYKSVRYDDFDDVKGSDTLFLLAGAQYSVAETTVVSLRGGLESRERNVGEDKSRFYGELSLRHSFAENSWVRAGAEYTINETDSLGQYLDWGGPSFLLAAQYDPTGAGRFFVSGSAGYELRTLNARPGATAADADEESFVVGLAATYNIRDNWSIRATVDFEDISSDVAAREQERFRGGIVLNYSFGLFE